MKTIVLRTIRTTLYFYVLITAQITFSMEKKPTAIHNTGISAGEHAYLEKRLPIVKAALEKMLNRSLQGEQIPKIALICSGGGYRAALCATGSLCGAEKIGLLDATNHITSLSGGTWAVAPWISSGMPLTQFKPYLQKCMAKPFDDVTFNEKLLIISALEKKIHNHQSLSLVDPYGNLLGNRLLDALGNNKQKATLSEQAHKIDTGAYPYPIYTAIDGRETIVTGQTWYAFTPHTLNDDTNNIEIPTSTYGAQYKNGVIIKDTPEKTLAYCMGTWGSAFGANVHEIIKNVIHNDGVLKELYKLLPDSIEADRPLDFYAKVSNYMYEIYNIKDTTLALKKHMRLVDAGLEINLPYPPVSGICPERTPDILIFLDASAGHVGNELHKVVAYAQKHNLPFPFIDFENINKETISIFKDEHDTATPLVIYMPRISNKKLWEAHKSESAFAQYNLDGFDLDYQTNEGFCKTEHFQYTPEHSALVMDQTEFNMLTSKNAIVEAINWVIDRK